MKPSDKHKSPSIIAGGDFLEIQKKQDYLSPHFEEPTKRLRDKLPHKPTNDAADEAGNE